MKKNRMSRKIFVSICLVTLAVLAAAVIIIMGALNGYFTDIQKEQLKSEAYIAARGVELNGAGFLDGLFFSEDYRVSVISSDGVLLYDNSADITPETENHLDREEVREAFENGYGESTRYSSTMSDVFIYSAVRLSDGGIVRLSYAQSSIVALFFDFALLILVVVILAVIFSMALAVTVTKRIIGPINSIDLDEPMKNATYEEIEPLMKRIDQQQKQLKADKAALELNEKIREEFTANVSHELKTPLQTISGYAEIMQAGIVKAEDLRPFASRIYQESHRLTRLVEDIIDLTKLDGKEGAGKFSKVNIYTVAENVIDSLYNSAEIKNVSIKLTGENISIYSEPEMLHSIIYNLCDNAIKYNRSGGSVIVNVIRKGHEALLTVSDTGVGIPAESLDRIFERFYRVDKSRSKEVGGTGLGLSIVKHAAMMLDAVVSVESEVGKGSTFTVKFKL